MIELNIDDSLRFHALIKAAGKGIAEGVRTSSQGLRAALLDGTVAVVGENDGGGLTAQISHAAKLGLLGFKFHTYADGSVGLDLKLAAADLKHFAAVLDMGAAALAEMDTHSMKHEWANSPSLASTHHH